MKHYSSTGRPLKRLLDMWDQNRSTSGPTPLQIYDDDDDDDDDSMVVVVVVVMMMTVVW